MHGESDAKNVAVWIKENERTNKSNLKIDGCRSKQGGRGFPTIQRIATEEKQY